MRFLRGAGLLKIHGGMDSRSDVGLAGAHIVGQGGRPLLAAEAELLFQRATTHGLQSRGKKWAHQQRVGSVTGDAALQIAQMYRAASAAGRGREGRDDEEAAPYCRGHRRHIVRAL